MKLKEFDKMIKQTKVVVDNVGKRTVGELNDYVKKLEQALDEIEKILRQPQFEYDNIPCNYEDDIEKIKKIIQKAKGDVKNEN